MKFKDKYTNDELLKKDPIGEKDKTVISLDSYAYCEMIQEILDRWDRNGGLI